MYSGTEGKQFVLLDIENSVVRVGGGLVLGRVTNQALLVGKGDVGRSDSVTLIVDENFDLALLHHTDAGVGCAQILKDSRLAAATAAATTAMSLRGARVVLTIPITVP